MNRCENIVNYLNMAMIEAQINYAKKDKIPLCIVKFKYEVDLDNTFFFKDFFKEFYSMLDFPPIFYDNKDNFIIIFRNLRLQESITLFKKVQFVLYNKYNINIDRVGISELDMRDTYQELLERANRYLVISKRLSVGKIIYGLRDFDFYNSLKREDSLNIILSKNPNVKIYNFYNGIPIKEEAVILEFTKNTICLRTTFEELLYLQKNEDFLYIRHKEFPNTIKGRIFKYDFKNLTVCIRNIEFQDNSVVNRESIRIVPSKTIRAMIECKNTMVADGIINSISIDSIVLKMSKNAMEKIKKIKDCEFILKFRLFSKNSIAIDNISLKAKVFTFSKEETIFLIMPNSFIKNKILSYISVCANEMIKSLKQNILRK